MRRRRRQAVPPTAPAVRQKAQALELEVELLLIVSQLRMVLRHTHVEGLLSCAAAKHLERPAHQIAARDAAHVPHEQPHAQGRQMEAVQQLEVHKPSRTTSI